jgi:hypothetical protein
MKFRNSFIFRINNYAKQCFLKNKRSILAALNVLLNSTKTNIMLSFHLKSISL